MTNNKSLFLLFFVFNVMMVFFGVSIIPKWQINDSWSIAILFGWFLERPKMWPKLDPRTPYLSPKYFKIIQENIGTSLEILFSHQRIWNYDCRWKVCVPSLYLFIEFTNLEVFKMKMANEIWKFGNSKIEMAKMKLVNLKNMNHLTFGNLKTWKLNIWILKKNF